MYNKILVPLDGSELAECVLPHVEVIAKDCNVPNVILATVVEPIDMRGGIGHMLGDEDRKKINARHKASAKKYLKQLMSRVNIEGTNVQSEIIKGKTAADAVADYVSSNNIDLIIIATHGRSGVSRWFLGSVADRILRFSCVPVLMVRAPGCAPDI